MCFIRPLKVKKIENKTVFLENGIKAYYDKKTCQPAGRLENLKINDIVLVYGNLVIDKVNEKSK